MKSKFNFNLFCSVLKCLRLEVQPSVCQLLLIVQLKPHKISVADTLKAGVKFDCWEIHLLRTESFHNVLMGVGSTATQSAALLIVNLWLFTPNLRGTTDTL